MSGKLGINKTNGITLVSLIVTVVLLIILAAVGLGTLSAGGLFDHADYAAFSQNIKNYQERVGVYVIREQEYGGARYDINVYDAEKMKEIIPDLTEEEAQQYVIQDNVLKYRADKVSSTQKEWLTRTRSISHDGIIYHNFHGKRWSISNDAKS